MSPSHGVGPLLISIAVAISSSLVLARADDAAGGARLRQQTGLTRGAIVDRRGIVLAHTIDVNGKPVRAYSLPSTVPVVGYQDVAGHWHGIEHTYNSFLTADRSQRDWETFFLNLRGQSADGGTVQLALDSRLQRAAARALGRSTGAVVALDPRSGAVLAMVSKPYCLPQSWARAATPHQCPRNEIQAPLNRATQLLLAPGSAFKIVTLTAALDTGRYRLESLFSGADIFGPSPYFNNSTYPSNVTRPDLTVLTLAQALAFSDNFTFAHIGLSLGSRTFLRYAHRFLVGRHIPFDIPVKESVVAANQSHTSPSVLAQSSFGATTDRVTPFQMALIACAVANHGTLMAPQLVSSLWTPSGRHVWEYHDHAISHVMSSAAARSVTAGMVFVVNHGSGFNAQIAGVQVAGKTGTAASGKSRPHAWFIAFAPARHPVVAVAVLDEYSGEGFEYAAPIARKVIMAALRDRGYRIR